MKFSFHRYGAAFSFVSALFFASPALAQQSAQAPPDIRVNVDRVNVGVLVSDYNGQFVGGLGRENFHIYDDGIEQPITDFLSVDEPAQVLLFVEAGPAVYLLQGSHLQAVHSLLDGLAPNDRVAIARYNEKAEPILNFTPDKPAATNALDQLHFNLGFGQLNLASSLSTALDWLERIPGKKSLVLLSTGVDTSPPAAVQNLLLRLKSADVRVLAVSLSANMRGAPPADKKRSKKNALPPEKTQGVNQEFDQADEEMRAIAQANGGRAFFPVTPKDFADVFTQIAQFVRHEYNLGFVPPARDGKIHTIDVRVTNPAASPSAAAASPSSASGSTSYRIDHRQAYIAPSPEQR